jgi:undecaprenol kinase
MRRRGSLWRSFACAGAGVLHGVRTQRNVRIHAAATGLVVLLAATLRVTAAEWTAILLAIGLVWTAELLNTAIETVVDLVSLEDHELARIAKDTSSGAVLAAAAAALLVGIVIFAPRLWSLWR